MKNKVLFIIVFLCSCTISGGPIYAAPMTFTFNMPAFNFGPLAGQTSTLEIMANNGSSSYLSQSFLNTDIISYITNIDNTIYSSNGPAYYGGSVTFLTTDAAGIPTLDLSSNTNAHANTPYADGYIQLGTGNFTDYCIASFSTGTSCLVGFDSQILGNTRIGTVSIPSTLILLSIGLICLGGSRRKKVKI